jgi:sugar lactone lactonase YvrE
MMTRANLASWTFGILGCVAVAIGSLVTTDPAAAANLPRLLVWESEIGGSEELDLRWPVAVAAASAERIAVADSFGPRLMVFRGSGAAWTIEASVELPGMPVGLVHDGSRFVASLRGGQGLVAFEGPKLVQRRIALPKGTVPGPVASLPDGGLLVYDLAGERMLELGPRGGLEREIATGGSVTAVAATYAGGFFTTIAEEGAVHRYDANGRRDATWSLPRNGPVPAWPSGVAVDPLGDLVVVDRHGDRVLFLDSSGKAFGSGSRRGSEPGLLRYPSAIAQLPNGKLVVADQGNGRLQVFRRSDRESGR